MKILITFLLLVSTNVFAGNIQSLRTDGKGKISAIVRGEGTTTIPQERYFESKNNSLSGGTGTGATADIFVSKSGLMVSVEVQFSTGASGRTTANGTLASNSIPAWAFPARGGFFPPIVADFANNTHVFSNANESGGFTFYFRDLDTGAAATWIAGDFVIRFNYIAAN